MVRAFPRLLETLKPGGKAYLELHIPKKWYDLIEETRKLAYRQRIEGIDRVLLATMINKFKPITSVTPNCEDVHGYCKDDYRYVCSAIFKFRSNQLWVMTCLDKTLSEDKLKSLLKEQLGGRCTYNLVEKVAGDTGIYVVCCNIDERFTKRMEGSRRKKLSS